jgi:probable rRNA maturation factor
VRVHIVTRGVAHSIPHRLLRRVALTAMRAIRRPGDAEVEVVLTDDTAIARLNRRFLGHQGPTDVITFPSGAPPGDRVIGEVVISLERARVQAREAGWPVRREVALLLAHGILHLGGWEDHTSRGAARMRAAERAVLGRVFGGAH